MTTVPTTVILDYSDNLAAAVILSQFAQRQRATVEELAAYPAIAATAISHAEACERVAAALDRARERREPAPWVDPWANHTEPPY